MKIDLQKPQMSTPLGEERLETVARSAVEGAGWPRVVTDPGLPQIRTCAH